jgi:predicted RNA binding protein YcfA (HicA-like mRNA interferase family)
MPDALRLSGLRLARHGFEDVRRRESHIVMQKQVEDSTVTAIVPNHGIIRRGTSMSIIRQSGLPKREFER